MRCAGIVAEYNPFHRGHAYQIAQTRAALGGEAAVVCAMSGHWVQQADCGVADKWTTGGAGTLPYTAVGGTMMLSALAYSFIHRKRRREGRADD